MTEIIGDRDYLIRVIQYLDFRHQARFFITPRDFDILYRWWEKGIPFPLLFRCLDEVVERRRKRGKPVDRFSVFANEVRKAYQSFLTMTSHEKRRGGDTDTDDAWKSFMDNLPEVLESLRELLLRCSRGEPDAGNELESRLTEMFAGDEGMQARADQFLENLALPLRKIELRNRYCFNYLVRRYRIPIE